MTDVLKTTMTNGTGSPVQLSNIISAGKTGSTNESKDGWFAGYTKYYTTVVWAGYDSPKPVEDLYGSTYPGRIWKQYMDEIHIGLENKDFDVYENLQAEEDAIRPVEEQKILVFELDRDIPAFLELVVESFESIANADNRYYELLDKANRVVDETKRNEYINI